MSAVYDALAGLSPVSDAEILDGYRRYDSLLTTVLTPDQLDAYATFIRQTGQVRIFEELTPEELAALPAEEREIATAIVANESVTMENRRVAALLNQRGAHDVAPDLGNRAG